MVLTGQQISYCSENIDKHSTYAVSTSPALRSENYKIAVLFGALGDNKPNWKYHIAIVKNQFIYAQSKTLGQLEALA